MKIRYLFLVPLLLTLAACSSVKVTSDYDKEADFAEFKTFNYYGWQEDSDRNNARAKGTIRGAKSAIR